MALALVFGLDIVDHQLAVLDSAHKVLQLQHSEFVEHFLVAGPELVFPGNSEHAPVLVCEQFGSRICCRQQVRSHMDNYFHEEYSLREAPARCSHSYDTDNAQLHDLLFQPGTGLTLVMALNLYQ